MSDNAILHVGENSPEQVAYKLFLRIGLAEEKLNISGNPTPGTDRKWILETYAECLAFVKGRKSSYELLKNL